MTKHGINVWSKLVFERIGFKEFMHWELPEDLRSLPDLLSAYERGYVTLVRKHYIGTHPTAYRNVYRVTKKGAGVSRKEVRP